MRLLTSNAHQQMNRERLGVNQTYNVPVMQGTINPTQRNTTSRMVFIDSSQKQFLTKCGELNTDFTLDLSEPLTNVISMRLHSVQIPNTWYTFSPHLGNTAFTVTVIPPSSDPPVTICVQIRPGTYTGTLLEHEINWQLYLAEITETPLIPGDPAGPGLQAVFDYQRDKMGFRNYSLKTNNEYLVTFYSPTGLGSDSSYCDPTCTQSTYRNQNLGWSLGLRDLTTVYNEDGTVDYANPSSGKFTLHIPKNPNLPNGPGPTFYPCAPIDTYGPKSFFLVVDDYNQNRLNKGVVSMSDRGTSLPVPSYYEPGIVGQYTGDLSCAIVKPPPGLTGPARAGRVVPVYPRRLTRAQMYTVNEILDNRNTADFRVPPVSNDNVLGVIPLVGLQRGAQETTILPGVAPLPTPALPELKEIVRLPQLPFIAAGADLPANGRSYFGPVDIERMRVKLIDDKGNIVDLNNSDWSFTLCVEQLYQY